MISNESKAEEKIIMRGTVEDYFTRLVALIEIRNKKNE
jgi:hypothetical protein